MLLGSKYFMCIVTYSTPNLEGENIVWNETAVVVYNQMMADDTDF